MLQDPIYHHWILGDAIIPNSEPQPFTENGCTIRVLYDDFYRNSEHIFLEILVSQAIKPRD